MLKKQVAIIRTFFLVDNPRQPPPLRLEEPAVLGERDAPPAVLLLGAADVLLADGALRVLPAALLFAA